MEATEAARGAAGRGGGVRRSLATSSRRAWDVPRRWPGNKEFGLTTAGGSALRQRRVPGPRAVRLQDARGACVTLIPAMSMAMMLLAMMSLAIGSRTTRGVSLIVKAGTGQGF